MKKITLLTLLLINLSVLSQEKTIPTWFIDNMKNSIGEWKADNSKYKSKNEPITSYSMEWKWSFNKKSIDGTLYGFIGDKKIGPFWKFKQYWDLNASKGAVVQYGADGTIGIGNIENTGLNKSKTIQTFTNPKGISRLEGHVSKINKNSFTSTSFEIDKENKWNQKRTYKWIKQDKKTIMNLGQFSISLSVKNIKKSKEFYQNLGFIQVDGNINQKWIILKNNKSKIGLFQGMFPTNTLTFNTTNVREIFKQVEGNKTQIVMKKGMNKTTKKASFMIMDPDGNPILFDQL